MKDLERILERKLVTMFPNPSNRKMAESELSKYGQSQKEPQSVRVKLAILKLAGNEIKKIHDTVLGAKEDYRDIILWAEQPNLMTIGMQSDKLSVEEEWSIEQQDWEQYHLWLS